MISLAVSSVMHRTRHRLVKPIGVVLWTIAILYAAYVFLPFLPAWLTFTTKGRVVCAQCGAREHRTRYAGLVLEREPYEWDSQAWWDRIVPVHHQHEWQPVGCWWTVYPWSWSVTCVIIQEDDLFFASLPRFLDQDLARAVARRLGALEPEERWSEVVDSAYLAHVESLVRPTTETASAMPYEMQARVYEEWRENHPRWHDLFPPTLDALDDR